MMRLYAHHDLEQWLAIHAFYNGLLYNTGMTFDVAAGGALIDKPFTEAYNLIEICGVQQHVTFVCKLLSEPSHD